MLLKYVGKYMLNVINKLEIIFLYTVKFINKYVC